MARGRPIVIEFAAKTRDYLRGTRDVQESTEDIAKELKEASRDADRFESDFSAAMKDAERAAERASRDMARDFSKVEGEMGDIGREAGDEFKQNLGSALASGDIESVVQDSLGGLVSGLKGPLGGAVAVLAGLGALAFQQMRDRAEEVKEFAEGVASSIDASFDVLDGRIDATARKRAYADWLEDNKETLDGWADAADRAGVSIEEFAYAAYHGGDDAERIRAALEGAVAAGTSMHGEANPTPVLDESALAAESLLKSLDATVDATDGVRRQQDLANNAMDHYLAQIGEAPARVQRIRAQWDSVLDSMRSQTIDIDARINWYNVGPGAAYVDPGNRNYSPGHVAISNALNSAGRR